MTHITSNVTPHTAVSSSDTWAAPGAATAWWNGRSADRRTDVDDTDAAMPGSTCAGRTMGGRRSSDESGRLDVPRGRTCASLQSLESDPGCGASLDRMRGESSPRVAVLDCSGVTACRLDGVLGALLRSSRSLCREEWSESMYELGRPDSRLMVALQQELSLKRIEIAF